jgi:hypothetical protein
VTDRMYEVRSLKLREESIVMRAGTADRGECSGEEKWWANKNVWVNKGAHHARRFDVVRDSYQTI